MIGKRNLSSAMAKSGSDNAPSKRGKKNGDSDTKSLSSSGKSEGLQTSVLGNAVAAASKPAGTLRSHVVANRMLKVVLDVRNITTRGD